MEKYCLNINTNILQKKIKLINNYNFNFDFLKDINFEEVQIYYNILNNVEEFKLKNFYNHLFKKINKLNISEKLIKINIEENISEKELNDILYGYIKNEDVRGIIIMNIIQQYYYPI
jgi:hypothetical protein